MENFLKFKIWSQSIQTGSVFLICSAKSFMPTNDLTKLGKGVRRRAWSENSDLKKKVYKSENNSCSGSTYNSNQGGGGWAATVMLTNEPTHQEQWEDWGPVLSAAQCAHWPTSAERWLSLGTLPGHACTLSLSKSTGTHTKHSLNDLRSSQFFAFNRC